MTDTIDATVLKILNRHTPSPPQPRLLQSEFAYKEARRLGLLSECSDLAASFSAPKNVSLGDFQRAVWVPQARPALSEPLFAGWFLADRSVAV